MNTSFYKKIIFAFVAIIIGSLWATSAFAATRDLQGFAWSDMPTGSNQVGTPSNLAGGRGAGWISLNSNGLNANGTASGYTSPVAYKVSVDTTTGVWSGYAWSEHVGWINFAPSGPYPAQSGNTVSGGARTLIGGRTCGWARALAGTDAQAGGWDGWISMCHFSAGVNFDVATGALSGFAWGGDVLGWIEFNAPVVIAPIAGVCNPSFHNQALPAAPTTPLCTTGTASVLTGNGSTATPWRWSCGGQNGGAAAACTATLAAVGVTCGSANGASSTTAPSSNLCTSPAVASAVTSNTANGTWNWTCSSGTTNVSCSAQNTNQFPVCGSSANTLTGTTAPTTNLCSVGTATTPAKNAAGNWQWSCQNSSGSISCRTVTDACNPIYTNAALHMGFAEPALADRCITGSTLSQYNRITNPRDAYNNFQYYTYTWQCVTSSASSCRSMLGQKVCKDTAATNFYTGPVGSGTKAVSDPTVCTYPVATVAGACGLNQWFNNKASISQCRSGIPTMIGGSGTASDPWSWTCMGTGTPQVNSPLCTAREKIGVCTDSRADNKVASLTNQQQANNSLCTYTNFCLANPSDALCTSGPINPIIKEN